MCFINKNILFVTFFSFILLTLNACGGGGGKENTAVQQNPDTVPPILSISLPSTNPTYTTNQDTVRN